MLPVAHCTIWEWKSEQLLNKWGSHSSFDLKGPTHFWQTPKAQRGPWFTCCKEHAAKNMLQRTYCKDTARKCHYKMSLTQAAKTFSFPFSYLHLYVYTYLLQTDCCIYRWGGISLRPSYCLKSWNTIMSSYNRCSPCYPARPLLVKEWL